MRIILTILSSLILSTVLYCQDTNYQTKKLDDLYSWKTATPSTLDSFYFNLPIVRNSNYKTHIRYSFNGQIIDLFSNDNLIYFGTLTNDSTEYRKIKTQWGKENKAFQYIFQTKLIDSLASTKIVHYLFNSGQNNIPTDSMIPNWSHLFRDCGNIDFQFKTERDYKEMVYNCPWNQKDSVSFKKNIISTYEFINTQLRLSNQYKNFTDGFISGTYSKDGYDMMTILHKKRRKKK